LSYLAEVHPRGIPSPIQAAFEAGVHYSTAKTILFFHKKRYNNYSGFTIHNPQACPNQADPPRASYAVLPVEVDSDPIFRSQI
jgi:hypothetical protein